jgi:hypothetical protein
VGVEVPASSSSLSAAAARLPRCVRKPELWPESSLKVLFGLLLAGADLRERA